MRLEKLIINNEQQETLKELEVMGKDLIKNKNDEKCNEYKMKQLRLLKDVANNNEANKEITNEIATKVINSDGIIILSSYTDMPKEHDTINDNIVDKIMNIIENADEEQISNAINDIQRKSFKKCDIDSATKTGNKRIDNIYKSLESLCTEHGTGIAKIKLFSNMLSLVMSDILSCVGYATDTPSDDLAKYIGSISDYCNGELDEKPMNENISNEGNDFLIELIDIIGTLNNIYEDSKKKEVLFNTLGIMPELNSDIPIAVAFINKDKITKF